MQWPMLQLFLWGGTAQAEGPCPAEPVTLSTIEDLTAQATRAFSDQDLVGLRQGRTDSLEALPCLHEPFSPDAAANLHRLLALGAFTEGDRARTLAELQAARALQPDVQHLEGLVLEGHPLTRIYVAASTEAEAGERIQPPAGGVVLVDGLADGLRPVGAAAVVQLMPDGSAISQTLILLPGEPAPLWPDPIAPPSTRRPILLLAATGTTALSAGVLYGLSWQAHSRFWDTTDAPIPDADLTAQQQRINRRAGAAAVLGGAAGVLGTLTIVYW